MNLNIFEEPKKNLENVNWKLYVDGAARNNPGPAGAGIYLVKDDKPILKKGFFLGNRTNNQAEYLALLLGIFFIRQNLSEGESIQIISDSELLVKQFNGDYLIKNLELKKMYDCAKIFLKSYKYSFQHILRENNAVADKLANEGINKKIPVPNEFLSMWCLNEEG
ncbi:ribonuclease HI family protein [Candidatus Dependentiae bacterium]|nr:ribonuclease HI family protein [Candidatus Dependentiae bacterium]